MQVRHDESKVVVASAIGDLSPKQTNEPRLSLDLATEMALANNPDLVTRRAVVPVANAALGVAQTYPFNPYVQIQYLPGQSFPGGALTHYVLLMQNVQLPRKQEAREQIAEANLTSAQWGLHQAELLNVAQTRRLYFQALFQRELVNIAEESHRNLKRLEAFQVDQRAQGKATESDVSNAKWDRRGAEQQLRVANAALANALQELARQLAVSPQHLTAQSMVEWLPELVSWPTVENLLQGTNALSSGELADAASELADNRPDVRALVSDVCSSKAAHELAAANQVPDVQIGPYYQESQSTERFYGFRAQMDIPVWNNGRPMERQRMLEWQQRSVALAQQKCSVKLEIEAALLRYQRALQTLEELRHDVRDDYHRSAQHIEQELAVGAVAVPVASQSITRLLQQRRLWADAVLEVSLSAAALQGASGLAIGPRAIH